MERIFRPNSWSRSLTTPSFLDIPQERISEQIVEQIDDVPVPQEYSSGSAFRSELWSRPCRSFRGQGIPQERISERIAEQIVDEVPGLAGTGALQARQLPRLDNAECPKYKGFFALFPERKKVRQPRPSRLPESSGRSAHGHGRLISWSSLTSGLMSMTVSGGDRSQSLGDGTWLAPT